MKSIKKAYLIASALSALLFSSLIITALSAEEKPKSKCEKCYRNAEGKVVCEAIPCAKDKK